MRFCCSLAIALIACTATAQGIDTTVWRAFFPLEVGNEWQYSIAYNAHGQASISYRGLRVVADTVADGETYFVVVDCRSDALGTTGDCSRRDYVRYRSTNIVARYASGDGQSEEGVWPRQPCGIGIPADSTLYWTCNSFSTVQVRSDQSVDVGPESLEDVTTKYLYYGGGGTGHDVLLAAGLGMVREHENLGSGHISRTTSIEYARVSGAEYGDPVFVAGGTSGGDEPNRPAAALSVFPNPAAGSATVALTAPTQGRARVVLYDVLGRAVASALDGPIPLGQTQIPLDVSGLTPGVYVVRADGAVWSAATRLVVGD